STDRRGAARALHGRVPTRRLAPGGAATARPRESAPGRALHRRDQAVQERAVVDPDVRARTWRRPAAGRRGGAFLRGIARGGDLGGRERRSGPAAPKPREGRGPASLPRRGG